MITKKPMWDDTFMQMGEQIAEHSTCCRIKVGCLITNNRRIVSMGYNGTPKTHKHCSEYFDELVDLNTKNNKITIEETGLIVNTKKEFYESSTFKELHKKYSDENELHAEQNAIAFAAKQGIATRGCTLYTTYSPCNQCSKIIISAGIKRVVYLHEYDRAIAGLELMRKSKIEVNKLGEKNDKP